jgi:UvrD-like helicase C-terminal domain
VRAFQSEHHEAHWIARIVGKALTAGVAPAEILVLARATYATEAVQTALARAGIPYRLLGSLGLYQRSEVRDALAYLTLLVNPADAPSVRRSPRRASVVEVFDKLVAFPSLLTHPHLTIELLLLREDHVRAAVRGGCAAGHAIQVSDGCSMCSSGSS